MEDIVQGLESHLQQLRQYQLVPGAPIQRFLVYNLAFEQKNARHEEAGFLQRFLVYNLALEVRTKECTA